MVPHVEQLGKGESGIHTVVREYFHHAPAYDIEFVANNTTTFDLLVVHAGMASKYQKNAPLIAMLHGMYFTADYGMARWAYQSNQTIVESIRYSSLVTVPSEWVGETLRREARIIPHVVPHGIDWDEWQHARENEGFILSYAKNRDGVDVCDSTMSTKLAQMNDSMQFVATFAKKPAPGNVAVTGVVPHNRMKHIVQSAAVVVSPAKETFGIGALEAMAAGIPVLTVNAGHVPNLVQHGVGGYCYAPGNLEDMNNGLHYCLEHRAVLSDNARQLAKQYSWEAAMGEVKTSFERAIEISSVPPDVSVVIPVYNKEDTLERAVNSALEQTVKPSRIIIVDDGSTDVSSDVGAMLADENDTIEYVRQGNMGVAHARNEGIARSDTKFVMCLDSDDWIDGRFIEACLPELEADNSLGIAYTGLTYHKPDGSTGLSEWPGEWDYDKALKKQNQIPTACLVRRTMLERLGGYRQRYAPPPFNAGAEDAELWLRAGAYGFAAKKVTDAGLFHYSWMSGVVSGNKDYKEPDYRYWHPWVKDEFHPILSYATPRLGKASHPIPQHDEPVVSVIIPVGSGHEHMIIDALDSLEAQTYRNWEAVVVWDSPARTDLLGRYSYVRLLDLRQNLGAGYARNRGVEEARGNFLLFLDADDWLYPEAIASMLKEWAVSEKGVYTDYVGIADVDDVSRLAKDLQKDVLDHNAGTGKAVIRYRAAEFDMDRAMRQPENPPYIWNNVTTLIPSHWHHEIGGFDETMESWEDLLYYYQLAWAGKEFVRIPEPLMVYRFSTGRRRQDGLQQWDTLLEYVKEKRSNVQL
jgi:glycosyltransferase involved in cell wall biosynthesis